ncbi:MAG: DEAD/DEAH box helicase [Phycisphaerales bacterium]|nr:DEAD/DEAH box helicase [Phycisphaerales bacterium]
MPRDINAWAERWRGILADRSQGNIHAQAHAKQILHDLDTAIDDWPRFRVDLDVRLVHAAHLMLVAGLDFLDAGEHEDLATALLARGAESLEFAIATTPSHLSSPDEVLKAAAAYHIAGHHARSYVLSEPLVSLEWTDALPAGLLALLRRDFAGLASQLRGTKSLAITSAREVGVLLPEGAISEDDALTRIGHDSLLYALRLYVEFVKRGQTALLDEARDLCRTVAELGRESRHTDLWWWGRATEHIIRELGDSSLWKCIGDIGPDTPYGRPINRYIEGSLGSTPCTVSLWPSQKKAIEIITADGAPSFCVRMPTSAGKTKIAELAIVRAILDAGLGERAKCLYIAPFRSLAVEIESTLSRGLKPLGIRVSEVYGGFDLTVHDERLIAETQVLVATPEKLDAALRLAPELFDDVRLVAIDEGHIAGDISERGIRAEFLFTRLLRKLGRKRCRHLFVSAVLPNPTEFATWIAGDVDKLVDSDWRPARLSLGECQWNGSRIRIDFDHDVSGPLDEAVFASHFIEKREVRGVPGVGQRIKPFPSDGTEAFAATAIRFTVLGTTLAFVPQSRHVESTAREILKALRFVKALAHHEGRPFEFPSPNQKSPSLAACLDVVRAEFGPNSTTESLLRAGIAIHHGSLPGRVRVAIERLIRKGEVKLIVATTTLGQGVNLPIRTVLIKGLQQSQSTKVDPMTVWNIAGRAGRAMRENEGFVLFYNDTTRDQRVVQRQRRYMQSIVDRTAISDVIGMLHRILRHTCELWQEHIAEITLEELCIRLAQDDFEWLPEAERPELRAIYDLVDQHLLAMVHESGVGPESLDTLQDLLRESLLFAQLAAHPIEGVNEDDVLALVTARVSSVFRRIPEEEERFRFYRMGLSLEDCQLIVALQDELRVLIDRMGGWEDLAEPAKLDLLLEFAGFALRTQAASHAVADVPDNVSDIIRAWLEGKRGVDLVSDGLAGAFGNDAGKTGRFLEDLCVYGLAWVLTALIAFARESIETDEQPLPPEFEMVPSMFKNGLPDPLAAVFAPYLEGSRALAMRAAVACPYDIHSLDRSIAWLQTSTAEMLEEAGLSNADCNAVIACQRPLPDLETLLQQQESIKLTVPADVATAESIKQGDPLLINAESEGDARGFSVFTMRGEQVGRYQLESPMPTWTHEPHRVKVTVEVFTRGSDGSATLELAIERLA